jgi:serine/threonine-protein kinase HipA
MNPNETGTGLKLNISENDNSLSIDLVMSVAGYFKLNETKSNAILNEMQGMISKWNDVAKNMGISNEERQRMRVAFNR